MNKEMLNENESYKMSWEILALPALILQCLQSTVGSVTVYTGMTLHEEYNQTQYE